MSEIILDEKEYLIACQELEDQGMLDEQKIANLVGNSTPYSSISLSRKGRNAYRKNFIKDDTIMIQQQVGTIIHGPVTDSNIQSIAGAANSIIQQAIQEGDASSLREEINQLVDKIVEVVKSDLKVDGLSKYSTAAVELKEEIAKSEPDPTVIQRLLGTIRFASEADGAIDLGKKGLELAVKIGPLLIPLQEALLKLL